MFRTVWRVVVMMAAMVWAADAGAQSISVDVHLSGGSQLVSNQQTQKTRISKFTIKRTAGGGFPAGTYGCTATITGNGVCNTLTDMGLWNPNGVKIATDTDEPMCYISHLSVSVELDSSAPSGEYSCVVSASGSAYETGNPVSGWGEVSAYWGDSPSLRSLMARSLARLFTPGDGVN